MYTEPRGETNGGSSGKLDKRKTGIGDVGETDPQRHELRTSADRIVAELSQQWKKRREIGTRGIAAAAKDLVGKLRQTAQELGLQDEVDGEIIRACHDLTEAGLASKEDAAEIEAVFRMAGVKGKTKISAK